ncbi:phospholipid-translocating P-type ATPase [Vararia minispora EC-137]|uniref:Phospholipid-translocating P-type ATPase n=1 Tax=Vararia minispora EC-137 TaxID=1314806 RepID=A0ACB8QZ81_9AGAM|nr:phospholipid-translocating P-type ATPase [Vararia minispora EC-137]
MSFFRRSQNSHPDDLDDDDEHANIDDDLRLRTVRTAHSTIAESIRSEQRAERRRSVRRNRSRFFRRDREREKEIRSTAASSTVSVATSGPAEAPRPTVIPGARRNVYVNMPLTAIEVDRSGEPLVRYVRNKVKTSKYTALTFVPKNLFEQFRRIANLYFLVLVVVQLFPVFGATTPQLSALPLIFILTVTAIKDAVEDYRRAQVDEELNTTATTKLGRWRNVNQPRDPRNWFERMLGLNAPGRVTKGVRKLREKDAGDGMRVVLRRGDEARSDDASIYRDSPSSVSLDRPHGANGRILDDIQSIDSHSYPPGLGDPSTVSLGSTAQRVMSTPAYAASSVTDITGGVTLGGGDSSGVINWGKHVTGTAQWERTLWKKLEVGDIVLLWENEQVPADIVVLSTSDPEGTCYVETKNLDGETNLKPRRAISATSGMISEEDIERSAFVLDSEPPHANLYLYNGVLRYMDPSTGEARADGVTINEMLLRGCSLRNTAWVIGLVVFTGRDSKIMLNGGDTPSKRSKIERETNFNVIVNFAVLLTMCIITAIVFGVFDGETDTSAAFFEKGSDPTSSPALNSLVTFVSSLIAFQNIVPISLYISIEIVKTIQAYFISQDVDMYYQPLDQSCVPKTWNISDDLGQIEYIFSDKTGTLTQNVMEFQKCSVHGVQYGEAITEAQRGAARREGRTDLADPVEHNRRLAILREDMLQIMGKTFKNRYQQRENITLISTKLAEDMADRSSGQRTHIADFFRALAVCHTVLADRPDPNKDPYRLLYKAESPDEAALVAAARDAGFPFVNKGKDFIEIEVMGQPERHVPLKLLEFNSTRKRMSVIARNPQGRIVLYCKGADSVIYERLAADHDPVLKDKTAKDMEAFANGGLRTLCIAYRYMTDEEYFTWSRVYDAATLSLKDRDEEIDKATTMVEHSLYILGATALEDKLQEGVPDAIETLHQAGIKLWILTGDKVQTAIEIAFSCNLLKNDMEVMILSADSLEAARTQIEGGLNKMASLLGPPSWKTQDRGFFPNAKASFAVVIDGDTLRYALDPALKELFLNLGTQCETVVCCRVSPAQKALTVKLVKDGRKAMTLSIGDGANDVAMIQEANIGIGLFGLEGSQAAMSADYAFGQFRFLTKLLIVHGRWSYRRIAAMHSNFFYKNVIWTLAGFWFLIYNGFSATYLFEYTFVLLYNLVFTSLPVIALGAFDQDVHARAALAFPQLYIRGIRGLEYTRLKFWAYMADGFYQSAVVFFFPYLTWTIGLPISWNGKTLEALSDYGTTIAVAAIFAANTYVGIDTHYWMVITWIVIIGSSIVLLLWILVYSFFPGTDFANEVEILFSCILFWATWVISTSIALLPRFVIKSISSAYYPTDSDIVREMWVLGDLKERLGIKHRRDKRDRSSADLEHTPIFQKPHGRSVSEISFNDGGYEPALTRSPGEALHAPQLESYLDTPPSTDRTIVYTSENDSPMTTPPEGGSPNLQYQVMAPSPQPSYYSVSDLPSPSPLPQPIYRHPSELYHREQHEQARGAATLQVPPNAYEMRARSPPQYPAPQRSEHAEEWHRPPESERRQLSDVSEQSYVTARAPTGDWDEDEDQQGGANWRASTYSMSGPHAM